MREIGAILGSGHSGENDSAARNRRGGMPLIRCKCGAQILLVPDIKAMIRALENHISEHKKLTLRKGKENVSPDRVRQILIDQILQKASATCSA